MFRANRTSQQQPSNMNQASRSRWRFSRKLPYLFLYFTIALHLPVYIFYIKTALSITHDDTNTGLGGKLLPTDGKNYRQNDARKQKGGNMQIVPQKISSQEHEEASPRKERKNGFEYHLLCGGCSHSSFGTATCGGRIQRSLKKNASLTIEEAGIEASRTFEECKLCHPDACKGGTKYWKYDATSPTILRAVTHFLPSIPSSWRIPPSTTNATKYFNEEWKESQSAQVLFEFNPTLVALDPAMIAKLGLGFGPGNVPAYLASYRVASNAACFPRDVFGQIDETQHLIIKNKQNYLGLALLRADLTMIPGSDIVVDLENELQLGYPKNLLKGLLLVDFRLFSFNGKIYLNINGPPPFIVPIEISIPKKPYSPVPVTKQMIELSDENGIKIPNLFGDGLEVTLAHDLRSLYGVATPNGKNYALFQAGVGTSDIFAELKALGPHTVQKIGIDDMDLLDGEAVLRRFYKRKLYPNEARWYENSSKKFRVYHRIIPELGNASISEEVPPASFSTVEEIWFLDKNPFQEMPNGGACCIQLDRHPRAGGSVGDGAKLLVGLGHKKVPYRPWRERATPEQLLDLPDHQYVSLFYAFEPTPPYRIVARSGLFCLPFSADDEDNPYSAFTKTRKLSLKRKIFECPQISFVSGITEKAGDETKVLVSYGINDCTPRIVEVEKSEIEQLLFMGPIVDDS